jgi:ubiquitin-activating enzyme E1 C
MYTGNDGVYTYTFEHQKKPECPVCGTISIKIDIDPDMILEDFLDVLKEKPDTYGHIPFLDYESFILLTDKFLRPFSQLKKPSLRTATKSLYMQAPPTLEKASRPNLVRKMGELVDDGDEITVTDVALPLSLQLKVKLIKA